MNRKDIINFCNTEIFPKVTGPTMFYMNCKEVVRMVIEWRRGNGWPVTMKATVDDGFLSINGVPVGRIAPKLPRPGFDEYSYHIEGLLINDTEGS